MTIEKASEQETPKEKALVPTTPHFLTVGEARILAEACWKSGAFTNLRSEAQAVIKIMAGQELGIAPIQSMTKLYIVNGRLGMGVEAMGTLLKRNGYSWTFLYDDTDNPSACEVTFYYSGQKMGTTRFTMRDAERAKLIKADGAWETYPKDLLFARAFASGARKFAPEALSGMGYTPEELSSIVEGEYHEVSPAGKATEGLSSEQDKQAKPIKEHWCPIHDVAFFKTAKMKWWAHPTDEKDEQGEVIWCSVAPEGMTLARFYEIAITKLDFKTREYIHRALKVTSMDEWKEPFETALDYLAQLQGKKWK